MVKHTISMGKPSRAIASSSLGLFLVIALFAVNSNRKQGNNKKYCPVGPLDLMPNHTRTSGCAILQVSRVTHQLQAPLETAAQTKVNSCCTQTRCLHTHSASSNSAPMVKWDSTPMVKWDSRMVKWDSTMIKWYCTMVQWDCIPMVKWDSRMVKWDSTMIKWDCTMVKWDCTMVKWDCTLT